MTLCGIVGIVHMGIWLAEYWYLELDFGDGFVDICIRRYTLSFKNINSHGTRTDDW